MSDPFLQAATRSDESAEIVPAERYFGIFSFYVARIRGAAKATGHGLRVRERTEEQK